ncbi:hypothetical protein [Actinomadura macrotermitis]|uniref:DUF1449 family protein n=1 Tax=Actinomadura macrotermitis TaxID=2585200 RepID=A0A7K0BW27_9ACTN|nr:hypothetical protein [Actinomadura macrotermitis]MQY05102.1 hypothetical protein [Actinomadura macrotermitis]
MGELLATAFDFPTALFTFALAVVVLYWVLVLLGALGVDTLDSGDGDLAAGLGLGGVPASVALSLLIALAWFGSLAGTVLTDGMPGFVRFAVLAGALVLGWLGTRLLVFPLRRILHDEAVPSRADFVGRMCVIRTGSVRADFGQAEVTASDGSSALVQVRRPESDVDAGALPLTHGSTALIFDYDQAGEFFWVMPYDAALDPGDPAR